jgi:hypothetical protein
MARVARTLRGTPVARRAGQGWEDPDPSAGGFHGYMSYTTKSPDT